MMRKKEEKGRKLTNDKGKKERFGLVSSFNGISTLLGYLMPKPFY